MDYINKMEPQIYHLSTEQFKKLFYEKLLVNKIYVASIKRYLHKDSLKEKCNNLTPSKVYVSEDGYYTKQPHNLLDYNDEYCESQDELRIFGNVLCVYGKKTYDKLPGNFKFTGNVLDISF
jgi:hypothetical protein